MEIDGTSTSTITGIIQSCLPSLTKAEKKVASIVLEKTNEVLYYTVTELADESKVGETSVLRFCRKIGFKGYQEFKLSLAKELSNTPKEDLVYDQDDYIQQLYNNTIKMVHNSKDLLNIAKLEEAIKSIVEAKSIYCFGVGSSGITALDAKNRFLRIGKRVDAISDPHIQSMFAATLGKGDLVIGFSVSGSTIDTNNTLNIAKKNGAKIIAVTNYARSPITQIADIILLTFGKQLPLEGGSLINKISQLLIIDLLCTGLAKYDEEHTQEMLEKTARSVVDRIL